MTVLSRGHQTNEPGEVLSASRETKKNSTLLRYERSGRATDTHFDKSPVLSSASIPYGSLLLCRCLPLTLSSEPPARMTNDPGRTLPKVKRPPTLKAEPKCMQ